ncbi:acyltransferase [Arthrobacter oryzae]|uniref:acyltransferase n=1 Tax=Arthrobacter oryzae TaxID=409290 RepID=UPI00359321FE
MYVVHGPRRSPQVMDRLIRMGVLTEKIAGRLRGLVPRTNVQHAPRFRLGPNATFEGPVSIGRDVFVSRNADILGPVTIGNNVFISRDCYIRKETTIADKVSIGPFVRIITDGHEIGFPEQRAGDSRVEPISIGEGTWIGASVTILGGVTIGAGSVIAAGSLVRSNVAPNTLVGGVPARFIRSL